MILAPLPIHCPVSREERVEAAEDRADQVAYEVARERSRG
jgi:hypothetical protein